MIDFILMMYFTLVFLFCRCSKSCDHYLSKESTNSVRGVMAIAIVLHHMSEKIDDGILFPFMRHMGYLIVAVFFAFSGYGLMISYSKSGDSYLSQLIRNRLPYVAVIYILDSTLYTIYRCIIGTFIPSLTIASYSWFILVQVFMYISFYVGFSIFPKSERFAILLIIILQTLFMAILIIVEAPLFWYISNYSFVIGLLWAKYNKRIQALFNICFWRVTAFVLIGFAGFSILPTYYGLYSLCRIISSSLFSVLLFILMYRICLIGPLWKWIGGISFEIYLLHDLVYGILSRFALNRFMLISLTIIITLLVARLASLLNTQIKQYLYKRL